MYIQSKISLRPLEMNDHFLCTVYELHLYDFMALRGISETETTCHIVTVSFDKI